MWSSINGCDGVSGCGIMSDVMLHGILRMPPELWEDDPVSTVQRHSTYVQASDMISNLQQQLDESNKKFDELLSELREIDCMGGLSKLLRQYGVN